MKKMIGLAALVLVIAACSSGGGQLTVEGYAKWCGEVWERDGEANPEATSGQAAELFAEMVSDLRSVTPPSELEDYHKSGIRMVEAMEALAKSQPSDEQFNPWLLIALLPLGEEHDAALEALDPEVRAQLVATGCADEEEED